MRTQVTRRRWLRRVVSLLIAFHVAAIVIAPAAVEPTSPFWLNGWSIVRPYVQTVFLDQGWNFFSPEPGPSTLISYRAVKEDGSLVEQRIPNKQIWPRLHYHRHFMVTSFMGYQEEAGQQALCDGFIAHIAAKHEAKEVEFTKWVHLLPSKEHIRDGGTLGHPDLWEEYVYVEEELEASEIGGTELDSGESEDGPKEDGLKDAGPTEESIDDVESDVIDSPTQPVLQTAEVGAR